jgi:hypothetical protein
MITSVTIYEPDKNSFVTLSNDIFILLNKWFIVNKLTLNSESLRESRKPLPFMEPKGSLACSQEPTTGPYPEPDKSSALPPTIFL